MMRENRKNTNIEIVSGDTNGETYFQALKTGRDYTDTTGLKD